MDYEKKYKEALEQAKKELAQSGRDSDSARQILRFFPELTESEDERIRNEILIYIGAKQDIDLEVHNRWCTYLEKPKEQKPVKCELEDAFKYYTDAGITVSCGDIVAKPKEQKPYEPKNWPADKNALTQEQKPAEWSEDFDKEVESVHKRYPEVSFAKLTRIAHHFAKWADKYKSTEWSEEDKRALNDAIVAISMYANGQIPYILPSILLEDVERLKSLRPSWNRSMIQWTGKNLKEVIDFTGKSPKFNEWFKSWDEFESYVHSHGDIIKLFGEDGSYYEVPVGAWIIKTPDGYNIPSRFKFVQKSSWSEEDENVIETLIRELRLNAQFEFAVRKLGLDYNQTLTVLDKCRRLCPQSHWKPSEKECENKCPNYSEGYGCSISPQKRCETCGDYKTYNSWKPSKEQMEAIKHSYNSFPNHCPTKLELKSLYEQLKKQI